MRALIPGGVCSSHVEERARGRGHITRLIALISRRTTPRRRSPHVKVALIARSTGRQIWCSRFSSSAHFVSANETADSVASVSVIQPSVSILWGRRVVFPLACVSRPGVCEIRAATIAWRSGDTELYIARQTLVGGRSSCARPPPADVAPTDARRKVNWRANYLRLRIFHSSCITGTVVRYDASTHQSK